MFSIGWCCVYDIEAKHRLKVSEIRKKAFKLYAYLIEKDNEFILPQIAENLIKKLQRPYLRMKKLSDNA
jgi:hypothetical protein